MDWFKHRTHSHEDPDISDAWDEFGDAAIVVFWTTLEVYGCEFSHLDENGFMHLTLKFFERKLRRKWKKIEKILSFYQNRTRILFRKTDLDIYIKIPKFLNDSSNWTKRKNQSPTEAPHEAPTEAPLAKEAEQKQKQIRKEAKAKQGTAASCPSDENQKTKDETTYEPPDQDTIKNADSNVIEKLIGEIEVELTIGGIMKVQDLMRFKKNCNGANRRAILHTLVQCYEQRPRNPGGFCRSVLEEESPNYFALENERAAEIHKATAGEAGKVLEEVKNHEPV